MLEEPKGREEGLRRKSPTPRFNKPGFDSNEPNSRSNSRIKIESRLSTPIKVESTNSTKFRLDSTTQSLKQEAEIARLRLENAQLRKMNHELLFL